ncbi:MAG TPA: M14 family metallopeptidase [Bdellovibrionota bacterium]|jgi:hypothetical protein
MIRSAFIAYAFFSILPLAALAESSPVISSYFLPPSEFAQLPKVSRLFEIEHRQGNGFVVDIPADQSPLLLALAPGAQLMERDVSAAIRRKLQEYRLTAGVPGYHSFDQVQDWMHAHQAARSDLVQVVDYGLSKAGRALTALHLASEQSKGKPVVMITAATHGDELITTEVLMHLVDRLVAAYHKEDRLTKLVDSHDIYFVPVLNPDGFASSNRYDGNRDPNRSYPYPNHENMEPTPSIAGIIKLFSSLNVKASIDFHAYGELIMYPWAYTHDPVDPTSRTRFDALTRHMAETNRYTYGPIADVIYVAPGSSADYYFWKKGSTSLGIEIGDTKIPSPAKFPEYFESQEESTWRFLEGI